MILPTFKEYVNEAVVAKNLGHIRELKLGKILRKDGLMKGATPGFKSGHDFHLIDKREGSPKKILGKEHATQQFHYGETKNDINHSDFGQVSLNHTPEKGWHVSPKTVKTKPLIAAAYHHMLHHHYAKDEEGNHIMKDGKKVKVIDHLNASIPDPKEPTSKNIYSVSKDLSPMHAYLKENDVDVLHIGDRGTFRAGQSLEKDRAKLGLPIPEGEGKFRIRKKHKNGSNLMAAYRITTLKRSHINLEDDAHRAKIKKKLGHD